MTGTAALFNPHSILWSQHCCWPVHQQVTFPDHEQTLKMIGDRHEFWVFSERYKVEPAHQEGRITPSVKFSLVHNGSLSKCK